MHTPVNLQWVQLGFFFLAFLRDIMPGSYARQMLGKFCDFIFNSLVFPLALVSGKPKMSNTLESHTWIPLIKDTQNTSLYKGHSLICQHSGIQ